jgi:hypothetical protein
MQLIQLKQRLKKDRPATTVTMRMPVDVVDTLKRIAPLKGMMGYQTLLKSYISDGLRRDEAVYARETTAKLIAALRARGVPDNILQEAALSVA